MNTVHENGQRAQALSAEIERLGDTLGARMLLIEPGEKRPARGWGLGECNPHPATARAESLIAEVTATPEVAYNLAVVAGHRPGVDGDSRLVIVDLDTTEEVSSFESALGSPVEFTVRTPGKVDESGQWKHAQGGHIWYVTTAGDDELHSAIDSLGARVPWGGGLVMLRDSYALCPPSVRAEGAYHWAGAPLSVPAWLREALLAMAAEKREKRNRTSAAPLPAAAAASEEQWEQNTPWHELLLDSGLWVPETETASCGCDMWRYSRAANPRSAIAHEPGCGDGHKPVLHLFSETARGDYNAEQLFKLAFYAHHRGLSLALARAELGLPPWREQREIWSAKGIPATPATPAVQSGHALTWRILAGGAA